MPVAVVRDDIQQMEIRVVAGGALLIGQVFEAVEQHHFGFEAGAGTVP